MAILPLLAVALAVPPKRSSSALGVFLSIVDGRYLPQDQRICRANGSLGKIDPIIALWVPFLLFSGLCWWLTIALAHVPGGHRSAHWKRVTDKAVAALKRWLRGDDTAEANVMLATQFIPSRMIALYTGRLFLWRSLRRAGGAGPYPPDARLLSESGDILAYPGNGQAQLYTMSRFARRKSSPVSCPSRCCLVRSSRSPRSTRTARW